MNISFNLNSPTYFSDVIVQTREQLISYRKKTKHPEELEWEIRVYDFILTQPNPNIAAEKYFKARTTHGNFLLAKRMAVKKLGWDIK